MNDEFDDYCGPLYTANCLGIDGHWWPVYFYVDTPEAAAHIVDQLDLETDESGICQIVERDLH